MPHIGLKRDDIPDGTLQVLDLDPNESQRNHPYELVGQTKYVNAPRNDIVEVSAGPTIVTTRQAQGLAAFFLTTIDDGGGASLTKAEAEANAAAVLTLVGYGSLTTAASDIDVATVNAAITGTLTAGQHASMMTILAGRTYTVPSGVQVEAAGAFAVSPAVGAAGGPSFGEFRPTYDTGALTISFGQGKINGFMQNDFEYQGVGGTHGEAVVVYNDDGTVYTT